MADLSKAAAAVGREEIAAVRRALRVAISRTERGEVEAILDRLDKQGRTLEQIEAFCESHLPFASEKSEVVARRVLWAIRGSDDDPPHPDRRPTPS